MNDVVKTEEEENEIDADNNSSGDEDWQLSMNPSSPELEFIPCKIQPLLDDSFEEELSEPRTDDPETANHSDYENKLMVEFTSSEDEDDVDVSIIEVKDAGEDEEVSFSNLEIAKAVQECKRKKRKSELDSGSKSKTGLGKSNIKVCIGGISLKLECETCGKIFPRKFGLERHEKIHTNERPYKCDTCDKSFTQKAHLQKHERTHDRSKGNAGNGYQSKDNTEKRTSYKCNECGKEFNGKYYLNRHEKIHTDERDHKCEICKKAFRQPSHLKKHLKRVHGQLDNVDTGDDSLTSKYF